MANKNGIKNANFEIDNLVEFLTEEEQKKVAQKVIDFYESDKDSRTTWNRKRISWLKSFMQEVDEKDFPWKNCSNVPVPILTTAVIQFQARAYEALMPAKNKVKVAYTGVEDIDRAERVSRHMNYQLNHKMENFEEGWDSSLFQLPINGSCFRKTYYDPLKGGVVSEFCPVDAIIVDYNTSPTDTPERITHVRKLTKDFLARREAAGIYTNVEYDSKKTSPDKKPLEEGSVDSFIAASDTEMTMEFDIIEGKMKSPISKDLKRVVLEQQCWMDLDEDKIDEPYVITVDYESKRILRISKRTTPEGQVVDYYTHYYFFPNPEGYYGLGFGHILLGINEAAKSVLNQIIDAGTLANLSGKTGFINKRSAVKKGDFQLALGDYKAVDMNSDDIRKSIYSFEFEGPSQVLFSVLGLLREFATEVTTVSETLTGELPRSDTPATAVISAVEQGMKVFSTIHKRIHRAFKRELKKIYTLNSVYPDQEEYELILGDFTLARLNQMGITVSAKQDYLFGHDIVPVSDPNITSRSEKMAIAEQILIRTMQNPAQANNPDAVYEAHKRFYNALGVEDVDAIYPPPPPPPDLPQVEENAMFIREEAIDALPQQNHEDHLMKMEAFAMSPYFGDLTARGKNLYEIHKQQHLSFLYQQEAEGAGGINEQSGAARLAQG